MILQLSAGWLVIWGAALAASFSPLPVQVLFAIIAIGVIGMAHGASDLAIVNSKRQLPFLAVYGLVIVLCLLWWHRAPAVALPGFLIASAIHFALEDAQEGTIGERIARGVSLITTPAALHFTEFNTILQQAGAATPSVTLSVIMVTAGAVSAIGLLVAGVIRRDYQLLSGTLALLILPPFVGFSMGFLILHALPQTRQRRDQLGYTCYSAYLRATWPVLVAAILLAALTTMMMLPEDAAGIRSLFAALAALAIPHLLITPWFESAYQHPGAAG